MSADVTIIGAGLSGNLLAITLARHGLSVSVHERGKAPDETARDAGRSINLALAARGIEALKGARVFDDIAPLLLPMSGRIVHESDGSQRRLRYGQRPDERIWSVSRADLNRRLFEIARDRLGVDYRFESQCIAFDPVSLTATIRSGDRDSVLDTALLIAADGAGSIVRRQLATAGLVSADEGMLDHGYKELDIPPGPDGNFAMEPDGLHIWPRGGFMLIALPNLDRSFTVTLFLPHRGDPGFDSLSADNIETLFERHFADVLPLLPGLHQQFAARPVGNLGTVRCSPWSAAAATHDDRQVLLIGDAAHAVVPFHGQGMNAAFEDCAEIDRLLSRLGREWQELVPRFEAARKDNADAIARMALENYREMRDTVRDPRFEQRARLAFELERRFPNRFIPRYSMVMFHAEIGYAEAERRGAIQAEILDEAVAIEDTDNRLSLASSLVERRLPELAGRTGPA